MSYTEWTKQIGDQWVVALTRVEQGASRTAQTLSEATAGLPAAAELPLVERVTSLQEAFVSQLPSPEEIVRANFELTARVVDAQHEFLLSLLSFGGPTAPSRVAPSTPAAAKRAPAEPAATKPAETAKRTETAASKPAAKRTKRTETAAAKPAAKAAKRPEPAAAKPAAKPTKRTESAAKTTTSNPVAAAKPTEAPKGAAAAVADQPTEGAASKE